MRRFNFDRDRRDGIPRRPAPALIERLPFPLLRTGAQAGAVVGARLIGAAANVCLVFVLARHLSPGEVGVVLTALAAIVLGELVALLGRDGVAVQVLPQALEAGDEARAAAFVRTFAAQLRWSAPLAGLVVAAFVLMAAGASPLAAGLAGLATVATALLRALSRTVMAAGGVAIGAVCMIALRPLLLLAGTALLAATGRLTEGGALACALAGGVGALAVQAGLARRRLGFLRSVPGAAGADWARAGRRLLPTMVMVGEMPSLAVVLAGAVMTEADVAVFAVALRFAALLGLGTAALVAALGPRLSAAWGAGGAAEARRVGRAVPTIGVPVTATGAACLWLAAPWLLGLFGEGYAAGAWALRVLAVMPLASACAGPSLLALTAAGEAGQGLRAAIVAAPVMIFGVLVGGAAGPFGASVGLLAGVLAWEVGLAVRLRRRTGLSLWLPFGSRAR